MGIISAVLEINSDINYEYRTSKRPKFIKDIITKRRRKKVKKVVDRVHKLTRIDSTLIKDYIEVLSRIYAPYGTYRNCLKIEPLENDHDELVAMFKFTINEANKEEGFVVITPDSKNDTYLMRFVWSINGITKFVNAKENVGELVNTKSYDNPYPYSVKIENDVIKDCFCKCLMDNMYVFLMEDIERSERVTTYDRIKME